jgi:hypothetical protein
VLKLSPWIKYGFFHLVNRFLYCISKSGRKLSELRTAWVNKLFVPGCLLLLFLFYSATGSNFAFWDGQKKKSQPLSLSMARNTRSLPSSPLIGRCNVWMEKNNTKHSRNFLHLITTENENMQMFCLLLHCTYWIEIVMTQKICVVRHYVHMAERTVRVCAPSGPADVLGETE